MNGLAGQNLGVWLGRDTSSSHYSGDFPMPRAHDAAKFALWCERFSQFDSKAQTVRHFCQQFGISASKFYYWQRRVSSVPIAAASNVSVGCRKVPVPLATRSGAFVPVVVKSSQDSLSEVAILFPSGIRVHVPVEAERCLTTLLERLLQREAG